jgi:Kae1-associated kinase Bud32
MKMISEGAEARIYSESMYGGRMAVKIRGEKEYRVRELDVSIRRSRTKREARTMLKATSLGVRVPRIIGLGDFSIYMERIDGKLLKDCRIDRGMARRAGEALAMLHNGDIVHGDFTPANLMLERGRICVIDFGLADIKPDTEEKAVDLLLMKRSISPELYRAFESAYLSRCAAGRKVVSRLAEIEKRGRYQTRTLA